MAYLEITLLLKMKFCCPLSSFLNNFFFLWMCVLWESKSMVKHNVIMC